MTVLPLFPRRRRWRDQTSVTFAKPDERFSRDERIAYQRQLPVVVGVRLSADEARRLDGLVAARGLTRSTLLRSLLLELLRSVRMGDCPKCHGAGTVLVPDMSGTWGAGATFRSASLTVAPCPDGCPAPSLHNTIQGRTPSDR